MIYSTGRRAAGHVSPAKLSAEFISGFSFGVIDHSIVDSYFYPGKRPLLSILADFKATRRGREDG